MFSFFKTRWLCFLAVILISSCGSIDVFEKDIAIPGHEWNTDFQPKIIFELSDTSALYNIYVVIRHTDAYRYNNIWINMHLHMPEDTTFSQKLDLRLATDDKGWLGTGMDDIYEHRILINKEGPLQFKKPGPYTFRLEHIMREDPLQNVMNVGIRVEKAKG